MKKFIFLSTLLFSLISFGQNTITQAEYFIDTDLGLGNAQALSITSGVTLSETLTIPLNTVSEGFHVFHVRVKNNLNQWSLYSRELFYKSPQISNNTIVAAEYFIDTDPGVGNATAVTVTAGALIDETLNIAIPNNLSAGDHILHIRVLSSNDKWSFYGRPEFTSTLSNNAFSFETLKMYPNPVEDVLHLSIQNNTIEKVVLIDINGRIILEKSNNLEQINVSNLLSGLYLLQIKTASGSVSKKVIKK